MDWTDIIKNEDFGYWKDEETGEPIRNFDYGSQELFPLLGQIVRVLQNRVREMEGFLRDSDEEDEAYELAEYILRFSTRALGTGGGPQNFGLTDGFRNLIRMIDEKYAELVKMME